MLLLAEEFDKGEKYLQEILGKANLKDEGDRESFKELGVQLVKTKAEKSAISELYKTMT